MDFLLSSRSLKRIKESGLENDLDIILFDDTIHCSKFSASFLSSTISKILRSDNTINEIKLDFPPKSIYYSNHDELKTKISQTDFITCIKNLLEGEAIHIEENNKINKAQLFIEFGILLDNEEFIEEGLKLQNLTEETTKINKENVIEIIKLTGQLKRYQQFSQQIYTTVSQNFYRLIEDQEFADIDKEDLEAILSSPSLKIKSEDSLFQLIYSQGPEYYFLFDYIEIQYLSMENVERIIQIIDNYEISLHKQLWSSICRRLLADPSKINEKNNPRSVEDNLNEIKCDDGIIEYLSKLSKSNVYDNKIIDVETSKTYDGEIRSLFDKSQETRFRLDNVSDRFILIDFKDNKVNFSKYHFSVPSSKTHWSSGRPTSWNIEGSNDKNSWDLIDMKQNDESLNGWGRNNTFSCQNTSNKFYRYIKLKNLVSHGGNHLLLLSGIEFFGSLIKQ
ncbi:hypothetical protein M9Y10_015528 [Tritrichomonas musculus]|uniref:BACK domain-containing protein n=1 Tax=Tritrichomonas musculus TaxID=1915356 RepID=A0ABR2L2H8_9EUKA